MSGRYQLLPALSEQEFTDLKADIAAHGVRIPVDVDEHDEILDGHHRARAAEELGVAYTRRTVSGLDEAGKRSHALAVNLHRRFLTREQKRALIEASLKADPDLSNREHARRTATSDHTVATVRDELETSAQMRTCERRTDPRTGNQSQPATKAARSHPSDPPPQPTAEALTRSAAERDADASRRTFSENLARCTFLLAGFGTKANAAKQAVADWEPGEDKYPVKTTAARMREAADYLYAVAEEWPS